MATRPDQPEPIDPTIPGEVPPVIAPEQSPEEPEGLPGIAPDQDTPDSAPAELPPPV